MNLFFQWLRLAALSWLLCSAALAGAETFCVLPLGDRAIVVEQSPAAFRVVNLTNGIPSAPRDLSGSVSGSLRAACSDETHLYFTTGFVLYRIGHDGSGLQRLWDVRSSEGADFITNLVVQDTWLLCFARDRLITLGKETGVWRATQALAPSLPQTAHYDGHSQAIYFITPPSGAPHGVGGNLACVAYKGYGEVSNILRARPSSSPWVVVQPPLLKISGLTNGLTPIPGSPSTVLNQAGRGLTLSSRAAPPSMSQVVSDSPDIRSDWRSVARLADGSLMVLLGNDPNKPRLGNRVVHRTAENGELGSKALPESVAVISSTRGLQAYAFPLAAGPPVPLLPAEMAGTPLSSLSSFLAAPLVTSITRAPTGLLSMVKISAVPNATEYHLQTQEFIGGQWQWRTVHTMSNAQESPEVIWTEAELAKLKLGDLCRVHAARNNQLSAPSLPFAGLETGAILDFLRMGFAPAEQLVIGRPPTELSYYEITAGCDYCSGLEIAITAGRHVQPSGPQYRIKQSTLRKRLERPAIKIEASKLPSVGTVWFRVSAPPLNQFGAWIPFSEFLREDLVAPSLVLSPEPNWLGDTFLRHEYSHYANSSPFAANEIEVSASPDFVFPMRAFDQLPGETLYFRARSHYAGFRSEWGEIQSSTRASQPASAEYAFSAMGLPNGGGIRFDWSPPTGVAAQARRYRIERLDQSLWQTIATLDSSVATWTKPTEQPADDALYRIQALDAQGNALAPPSPPILAQAPLQHLAKNDPGCIVYNFLETGPAKEWLRDSVRARHFRQQRSGLLVRDCQSDQYFLIYCAVKNGRKIYEAAGLQKERAVQIPTAPESPQLIPQGIVRYDASLPYDGLWLQDRQEAYSGKLANLPLATGYWPQVVVPSLQGTGREWTVGSMDTVRTQFWQFAKRITLNKRLTARLAQLAPTPEERQYVVGRMVEEELGYQNDIVLPSIQSLRTLTEEDTSLGRFDAPVLYRQGNRLRLELPQSLHSIEVALGTVGGRKQAEVHTLGGTISVASRDLSILPWNKLLTFPDMTLRQTWRLTVQDRSHAMPYVNGQVSRSLTMGLLVPTNDRVWSVDCPDCYYHQNPLVLQDSSESKPWVLDAQLTAICQEQNAPPTYRGRVYANSTKSAALAQLLLHLEKLGYRVDHNCNGVQEFFMT
jgi:hypothetical protein